jgi:MoxR-like ATPase
MAPLELQTQYAALIPHSKGYVKNEDQTQILQAMQTDLAANEHVLLMGNQGVGKNKLTDHLLEMTKRPRQYIQLHR